MSPGNEERRPDQEAAHWSKTNPQQQGYRRPALELVTGDGWAVLAKLYVAQLAQTGTIFDADELTGVVGRPAEARLVGAVLSAAVRTNVIRVVGCRIAGRRLLRLWQGVDR